jgi:hypothetical protein
MPDLLSYLIPNRLTADLLRHGLGSADILANKFRAQMPDDVGIAWRETMRPALVRWLDTLAAQEKPR